MGIDLMVMPLGRYWAGDYITPTMQAAWDLGSPYTVVRPQQPLEHIPPGTPFGGPTASAKRRKLASGMLDRMRSLGVGIEALPWDENDDSPPFIARVDTRSAGVLLEDATRNIDRDPGVVQKLFGATRRLSHLAHANILIPHPFDRIVTHEGVRIGSLPRAAAELDEVVFSPAADVALADWRAAVATAIARRLPMVVDT